MDTDTLNPSIFDRLNHPRNWWNRASDLHASAGALWVAMQDGQALPAQLELGQGFDMRVACRPVYHMLCGLALELVMKAAIVSRGRDFKGIGDGGHSLIDLSKRVKGAPLSAGEKDLLNYYQSMVIWAGRYPVPKPSKGSKGIAQHHENAVQALTVTSPFSAGSNLQIRRPNGAESWQEFNSLWRDYAQLFNHDAE